MSDPYNPLEKKFRLTRNCLEFIESQKFPVHLITKSDLVVRDIDLLKRISTIYSAVSFTITTPSDDLSAKIEPFAPVSSKRFAAMKALSENGIYTGITLMPVLPFIEDREEDIEKLINLAHKNGCKYIIAYFSVTLRDRQREHFYKMLDERFPGVKEKYEERFGEKYDCNSPNYKRLYEITYKLCKKFNITIKMKIFQPVKINEQYRFIW